MSWSWPDLQIAFLQECSGLNLLEPVSEEATEHLTKDVAEV